VAQVIRSLYRFTRVFGFICCACRQFERPVDAESPIWQRPVMEMVASNFKLRVNVPKGRKRFPINPVAQVAGLLADCSGRA